MVRGLFATSDTLWMATDSGAYHYVAGVAGHHPALNLVGTSLEHIARVPGGDLWVSGARSDLFHFRALATLFAQAIPNHPPGPAFSGLSVGGGGVWCAQRADGASYLRAEAIWKPLPGPVPSNGAPALSVRSTPQVAYYPGWCQGLHLVTEVADSFEITQYVAANSSLEDARGQESCTVVADVALDEAGGFWAANRYVSNDHVLVYFAPGGTPQVVYGQADGLPGSDDMNVLLLTGGRLWIGYNGAGLGVLDFKGTPLIKSDDTVFTFTRVDDGLVSDVIMTLCADRFGKVWVGTPSGLARIDPEFFPFIKIDFADVQPADGEILALAADLTNTLWVGTGHGLARIPNGSLTADSTWFAGASPLPHDRVWSLALDSVRSQLWVGTENGLAVRPLLSGEPPLPQAVDVYVFPNPLNLRSTTQVATFDVPAGARVDIYTLAGDRVRSLTVRHVWDGTNDDGQPVASGLYLFRVTYANGSVGRGRLGLIRD
jgi:ligand-binding sensor domain-containing protein